MALVDSGADAGSQTQSHCLEGNDTLGDTCEFVPVTVSGDSITLSRSLFVSLSRIMQWQVSISCLSFRTGS